MHIVVSGVLLEMEVGIRRRGLVKGLKVPCLFMIAEVSIRCHKNPEVGIRRIGLPAYTPQYTTDCCSISITASSPSIATTVDCDQANCRNFMVPRRQGIRIETLLTNINLRLFLDFSLRM